MICKTVCGADGKMYSKLGFGSGAEPIRRTFGKTVSPKSGIMPCQLRANYYFLADYYLAYRKSNFFKVKSTEAECPLCFFMCNRLRIVTNYILQIFERLFNIIFFLEIVAIKLNYGSFVVAVRFQRLEKLSEIVFA